MSDSQETFINSFQSNNIRLYEFGSGFGALTRKTLNFFIYIYIKPTYCQPQIQTDDDLQNETIKARLLTINRLVYEYFIYTEQR